MHNINQKDIDRFWSKVDKKSDDECWNWIGCVQSKKEPYGRFNIKSKYFGSHRVSWYLHFGKIPKDKNGKTLFVCHHCDNPSCVNPHHLFLGTNSDNILDCSRKNRLVNNCGENQGSSILTEQQVLEIRSKYIPYKYTQQMLADEYGVCRQNISNIIKRKIWKHI